MCIFMDFLNGILLNVKYFMCILWVFLNGIKLPSICVLSFIGQGQLPSAFKKVLQFSM